MLPAWFTMEITIYYFRNGFQCFLWNFIISRKEDPELGEPFVEPEFLGRNQLIWIDTPSFEENINFEEKRSADSSYSNLGEINIIIKLLQKIRINEDFKDFSDDEIVFLTPYSAQKDLLSKEIKKHDYEEFSPQKVSRNCYTIDSYQGRQSDIVIISFVRNNNNSNVRSALGFLTETERLNVMLSRVKKRMVIVGNSSNFKRFSNSSECKTILDVYNFCKSRGEVISFNEMEELEWKLTTSYQYLFMSTTEP